MIFPRRHVVSVALTAGFAGCFGDRDASGSTAKYVDNGVLDYVGFVEGAAKLSGGGSRKIIEYTEPEQRFEATAGYRGQQATDETMRVSTDLSTAVPTAFPAPVYDSASDQFLVHVFANEAFVSFGDWEVRIGRPTDPDRVDDVDFEVLTDGVSHTVVDPEGTVEVAIVVDPETEPTGVAVVKADEEDRNRSVPQATFEVDPNGEGVTITHGGGDHISADRLSITVGDQRVDATFDDDPVSAGSTVRLNESVVDGRTVRLIWTNPAESYSATLFEWTPDPT